MSKLVLPLRPQVKQRPRFGGGRAYNSSRFEDWKSAARAYLLAAWDKDMLRGPVSISATFYDDRIELEITPVDGWEAPRGVRGDLDNLIGGLLDALQPKSRVVDGERRSVTQGVIADDKQVVELFIRKGDPPPKPSKKKDHES